MSAEGPRKVFDKSLIPEKNGGITIRSVIDGDLGTLKNPVKEKHIPPELLNNLSALVMEAFPNEFSGTEGQAHEDKLMKKLTKAYPTEQPMEVAERTLPTLAALSVDIESIAGAIMSTNKEVRIALNLDTMSKADQNKKLNDLQEAISTHWPSSGQKG